jgi:eukaryotic-like serine/threonine-protein kinase
VTPEVGKDVIVDGRYQVVGRIGSGGMADVFCAEDLQLGRKVALKLLYRRFAEDEEFVERFRREASAAAGLQHPNVVGIYDRGEWDGTSYIAMEYLEGRTLKDVVHHAEVPAPLEPAAAIDYALQILRAARFAHRRGIVHRDLKPQNVIIDGEGRAKVADFGIAQAGASDMTQTGSIMGTAQYLSPEQAQGLPVDARADLYSVGVILYELLTGSVPFDGDSPVTIALKQVNEAPVPPTAINPGIPPALEAVVLHALQKDPDARFADAEAFIAELERVRADLGAAPMLVEEEVEYDDEPRRRPPWLWPLLAALAVAGLIVGALLLFGGGDRVEVPRVIGANVSAATQALRERGFEVEAIRDTSDRPRNQVINQDPDGGTMAEQGSTVRITVSDGPGTGTVPFLRGQPQSEAVERLEELGFEAEIRREFDDEIGENRVIETAPAARTQLETGSTVTLVVSRGPERVEVPDVTGRSEDAARSALENRGLRVSVDDEETGSAEAGTVLRQSPAGGSRIREGGSVTIVVARQPSEVEVPDVTGRSEDAARSALRAAGFQVDTRQRSVDSPDDDGRVLSQSPSGGRRVERGGRVTITIGSFEPDLDPDPETPPDPGTGGTGGSGGTGGTGTGTTTTPAP